MEIVTKVMEKSWKFVGKNVYEPWCVCVCRGGLLREAGGLDRSGDLRSRGREEGAAAAAGGWSGAGAARDEDQG